MYSGLFIGIKNSYAPESQVLAESYIKEINRTLSKKGLPLYEDGPFIPTINKNSSIGRSCLAHYSSSCLRDFGEFAESQVKVKHLQLLKINPYRVVYLPIKLASFFTTNHKESIWGNEEVYLNVGSAYGLKNELEQLANRMGISVENELNFEEQIHQINQQKPLEEGEAADLNKDMRKCWLLMYEGARIAIEHHIALSLAVEKSLKIY